MEGELMSKSKFLIVFLEFLLMYISYSEQRAVAANCRQEFLDKRANAAKNGYCWLYQPHFWDGKGAERNCQKIGGHLVILDSRAKAKVLLQFTKDAVKVVKDGKYGSRLKELYMRMYRASVPWLFASGVKGLKDKEVYVGTGQEVNWSAYTDWQRNKHRPGQTRCTSMIPAVSLWKYIPCHYRFPSVCEQKSGSEAKPSARSKAKPKPTSKPKPTFKPKSKPTTPRTTPTTTTVATTTITTTPASTPTATTTTPKEEEAEEEYDEDYDDEYEDEYDDDEPEYEYYDDEYEYYDE